MRNVKTIWLLLITVLMLVSQASATTDDVRDRLPSNSIHRGYTYYGEEVDMGGNTTSYMQGSIYFAVYDTTQTDNGWDAEGLTRPGNGKYIYAYQIFNDYEGYSQVNIESFSIFGLDGANISVVGGSVGTEEDPLGGQDASGTSLTDTTATWDFLYESSDYTIGTDENSFFLIFSSDYSWVKGDYSLDAYNPDISVPGGDTSTTGGTVPEPITVALLGLGGLFGVVRRKRK